MDKEKIKNILVKIGREVEKWTKFIWDIITTCYVVFLGVLGFCIVSLCQPIMQAFNAGETLSTSPEFGLILVLVAMGGLILISVPLIYMSIYWRVIE